MKKRILPALTAFLMFMTCGCNSTVPVDKTDDLSGQDLQAVSDSAELTSQQSVSKIELSDNYYDFRKLGYYGNHIFLSARINDDSSNDYYNIRNTENDVSVTAGEQSKDIRGIVECEGAFYILDYINDDTREARIEKYSGGEIEKTVSVFFGSVGSFDKYIFMRTPNEFFIYDSDLNLKVQLSSEDYQNELEIFECAAIDSSLNSYFLSYNKENSEYKLIKINSRGMIEYTSEDFGDLSASCNGNITGFFVNKDKLYISAESVISDNVTQFINIVDTDTGKTSERLEIDNALMIESGGPEYDISYYNGESICGFEYSTGKSTEIQSVHENPTGWFINNTGLNVFSIKSDVEFNDFSSVILVLDENYNILSRLPSSADYFVPEEDGIYFAQDKSSDGNTHTVSINHTENGTDYDVWWSTQLPADTYLNRFFITENKVILFCTFRNESLINAYDLSGNLMYEMDFPYDNAVILCENKTPYILYEENLKDYKAEINISKNTMENPVYISENKFRHTEHQSGSSTEILFYDADKNILYKQESESSNNMHTYFDLSDTRISECIDIIRTPDGKYILTGYDQNGVLSLWKTEKPNDSAVTVKISGYCIPDTYREAAEKFNELNSGTFIEICDYSKYDTDEDRGFDKFTADIITDHTSDLILTDDSFDLDKYSEMGLFQPLNDYLNNSQPDSDSYYDYTFRYCNDELMQIRPFLSGSYILTFADDSSYRENISVEEFCSFCTNNNISASLSCIEKFLVTAYIKSESSEINFRNESFYRILRALKAVYTRNETELSDEDIYEAEDLYDTYIYGMPAADYISVGQNYGLPFTISSGSKVYSAGIYESCGISVSRSSSNKETAAEFIRFLLSDEFQNKLSAEKDRISASKNILHSNLSALLATDSEYLYKLNNLRRSSLISQFENNIIFDISGSKKYDIIISEIYEYYAGNCTEEEAAENIENKLALYTSEAY